MIVMNRLLLFGCLVSGMASAQASFSERVIDIPTRPGVIQRFLLVSPVNPRAAVVLFAGGHGGLGIQNGGRLTWGAGNFLVRSRQLFAQQDLAVAVVDAPSDRQRYPHLIGFRQSAHHATDIRAVISWLRKETRLPVWLIGTSRGTLSAAYLATVMAPPVGPDGIVLSSSILVDDDEAAVPEMPIDRLRIPVLVVHHEDDGCRKCLYRDMPRLARKIAGLERQELVTFKGGIEQGNPCRGRAHHGFNGIEPEVIGRIGQWIRNETSGIRRPAKPAGNSR